MKMVESEQTFQVTAGSWFSKKNRLVKVLEDKIQVLNVSDNELKHSNKYADCVGITKCLRIGSRNFVVHFNCRGDEEWLSDRRDEIIKAIADRFKKAEGKDVHIFGVSSPTLEQFLTTEKDILRKISRMPSAEFLISETKMDAQEDDDEIWGDDWIVVNINMG